jgi:predicted  nucleic acid-binding Zn-ribbon protein
METNDITVEILRDIRDAVRETNTRIDQTNDRINGTNTRLDEQTERLDRRITQSEVRTATAILALKGSVDDVKDLLGSRLDLRDRMDRREREIEVLKARIPA